MLSLRRDKEYNGVSGKFAGDGFFVVGPVLFASSKSGLIVIKNVPTQQRSVTSNRILRDGSSQRGVALRGIEIGISLNRF